MLSFLLYFVQYPGQSRGKKKTHTEPNRKFKDQTEVITPKLCFQKTEELKTNPETSKDSAAQTTPFSTEHTELSLCAEESARWRPNKLNVIKFIHIYIRLENKRN